MIRLRAALQALLPFLVMAALLAGLQAWVDAGAAPRTIASPSMIWRTLVDDRRTLWRHVEPTLLTASTGLLIATLLSLALGFLVYVFRKIEGAVLTVSAVLTSIPVIALAPALITLMGPRLSARITITAFICAFPMMSAAVQGLTASSRPTQELFTVLAASPWQRFRLLALPTATPYLMLGAKIAAPLSLLGSLIAEWTGAEEGLGVYMINAMFGLRIAQLWAAVAVACLLSVGAYGLVSLAESLSASGRTDLGAA
ncbi:MAG TPA: ABC transporter permease subunit [Caulobacteraceae bacterium]|nr:ABC transporter permease subunit [Caulobacteraceae bacterium]